ncbi:MAG: hypothetical protein HFI49_04390 [Bacilli bacterium]|jgi:hypothetical protein|nr:hypothetical protein [Bacilli bacterium]
MENKYYLAIETKPNNYFPLNLLDLKIFNKTSNKIEEIDSLTLKYTKKEIMEAIKEANLLEIDYDMPLVIIYIEKEKTRKVEALTKDNSFDMWNNLKENYQDKNYCNRIINFLKNKIPEDTLNTLKNNKGQEMFLKIISELPYFTERKLYFYLYEN